MSCTLKPVNKHLTLVSGYPALPQSPQADRPEEQTIWEPGTGWMSTIKLKKDCICLGHLAGNTQSPQENNAHLAANQSAHTIVVI